MLNSMATKLRQDSAWVSRFHPSDAPVRLVCFPHAGGAASYYHPLSMKLSSEADVLAIQYPGRQERRAEPCVTDLATLADLVAEELRPWTDRPLALFGHSMGALLSFEVARRLERDDVPVLALFVSGRRAPSRLRGEAVHQQGDQSLIAHVRQLSGTDSRFLDDPELLSMLLPALRSDYQAVETYRYEPGIPLSCPLAALIGDQDPLVTAEEAAAWRDHTIDSFELRTYPGGHFYLNEHLPDVTETIASYVRKARALSP